ncbi:hypothetical protein AVEN_183215-1 [Araneus ventricosus]|uniref:Uncharacterized protein n=1 Tax=Araneus ventricosus TaxID=182803 RepID=A0A4Y2KUA6_ARAVE|nr:hypothetical protein AVEN_183215-1 [Araneus ventricosus]
MARLILEYAKNMRVRAVIRFSAEVQLSAEGVNQREIHRRLQSFYVPNVLRNCNQPVEKSQDDYAKEKLSMVAVFVAAKSQNEFRMLEHVIKVSYVCTDRHFTPTDVKSEVWKRMEDWYLQVSLPSPPTCHTPRHPLLGSFFHPSCQIPEGNLVLNPTLLRIQLLTICFDI